MTREGYAICEKEDWVECNNIHGFVTILPVQIVATFHEQFHRIFKPPAGKYFIIVEF